MIDWPTIIVSFVLLCIVAAIIFSLIRQKKKGKRSCCGGCNGCALAGMCHKSQEESE